MSIKPSIFHLGRLRLTTRLSIAFSLICCMVFGGIGLLSYFNMQKVLLRQSDQNLMARIARVEVFLQDQVSFEILIQHPRIYRNMLGKEDDLFILKNAQQTLIEINPLNIQLPYLQPSNTIRFFDQNTKNTSTRIAYKAVSFDERDYLLITGTQANDLKSTLNQYFWQLIIFSLLGVIFASLLGRWVGLYLLQSLNQLIEQTHRIKGMQLQQRIAFTSHTFEVEQLGLAMNEMLDKIQIHYDQLARFSEDIAHELRTPLNNLMGQTQIMLTQSRSQQELEQLLYSHLEEYEKLSKMIDNMLFIARCEQIDYLLETDDLNLSRLINTLVDYFEFLAEEKQMTFVLALDDQIRVRANAELLKRAISNLIVNAIDYGVVQHNIVISSRMSEQEVEIEVLTQGVYIEEQHIAHLFERFYQIDLSRHAKAKTGGLGLAIVQSIMSLHRGVATVYNSEQGVVFQLKLQV